MPTAQCCSDISTGKWDTELLELFRIPASMLPKVRYSSEVYGEIDAVAGLGNMAVAGAAGDQQAALFGQMCVLPGLAKNTSRDWLLPAATHRYSASRVGAAPPHHGGLQNRGEAGIRAGGQHLHGRRDCTVAP